MEMGTNRENMSYLWKWDDLQGWNYTAFFSFFNDFGEEDNFLQYVEFGSIAVLSLFSFIVNMFLIIFFLRRKDLRNDLHMYTVSIMISSVLFIPFALLLGITRFSPKGWMFGSIMCKTTLYMIVATAFVKIWLMTLISVDRYLRVVHTNHKYMGRKLSITLVVLAWVLPAATLAGMVYPNSRSMDIDIYGGISICTVSFKWHPTIRNALVYFSTIFTLEFLLPAIIMTICYALIMRKINKSTKALRSHITSSQKKLNNTKIGTEKGLRSNMRRRRTTIILITIMVLFLIMWMPLFVLLAGVTLDQVLLSFKLSSRWVLGQICVMLLNTLIEPFLYSFTTAKVRNQLKHSLRAICCSRSKTVVPASSVDETSTQNYSNAS